MIFKVIFLRMFCDLLFMIDWVLLASELQIKNSPHFFNIMNIPVFTFYQKYCVLVGTAFSLGRQLKVFQQHNRKHQHRPTISYNKQLQASETMCFKLYKVTELNSIALYANIDGVNTFFKGKQSFSIVKQKV